MTDPGPNIMYERFAIRFSRPLERPRIYNSRGTCPGIEHWRQYQCVHGSEIGVARAAANETARPVDGGIPDPSGRTEIPFQHSLLPGRARAQPRISGGVRSGILEREPDLRR